MSHYHTLSVERVIDETHDSKSIVFKVPPALGETFRYASGQFLTLRIPHPDGVLPRCYSLSSCPGIDDALKVTVKRVRDGRASNWLCDEIKAGDTLQVMAPAGVFTCKHPQQDLLLFAGGSGITPVFSIAKSALLHGKGRVLLVYANRDERSVIFHDELRRLSGDYPARLSVIHWLDSVQGVPSAEQLGALARHLPEAEAFICGPAPFMDAAEAALAGLGLARGRVHIERFVSLPGENEAAVIEAGSGPAEVSLSVTLDGETWRMATHGGETLLDAMDKAGMRAPHSCRVGGCASCMCRVTEGEVKLLANTALDEADLADGWTLACQAVPMSASVVVAFPD
ncbi:ferredoxin--NADP reductase [Craterilacuibacter sinensis]|uniref:2Fe-2S iron-sulfur cluster binding domain-containing protein n=1 Tax=Craterilacuibacter sinensis TaxID=2686017 RepID=A0A845BQT8_9NEIS|nr:ferredoxin--NADP reductase [Craterilacuibacter sinensis]MXR37528.1 2Fe-2S iron-sulfur cluster binding domain-containing protein [Craterilacuibacter sinensis]